MNVRLSDMNLEEKEITIEEFDALVGEHGFSEGYQRKKQELLESYAYMLRRKRKNRISKLVAAIVLMCVVVPVSVYAATIHADFFDSMFGNSTKKNLENYDVVVDDGKGGEVIVEMPAREYEAVDEEKAEELIGDKVFDGPIVKQLGDHTLTIESVVYSKYGAQIAFTLEREGGVTMLAGDELSNQTKGAWFDEESQYYFYTKGTDETYGGDMVYIDIEKSTPEKLYCYDYVVLEGLPEDAGLALDITHCPAPIGELNNMTDEESDEFYKNTERETLVLSEQGQVPMVAYTSENGGYLEVSSISFCVDMGKGLGLSEEEAYAPSCLNRVEIRYKDGSNYVVWDKEANIDNTGYLCGLLEPSGAIAIAFNRLVDTDAIACILVNGVEYHLAE